MRNPSRRHVDLVIVTPTGGRSRTGNRNTAYRWAAFLRAAGHRVRVQLEWDGSPADALIALHARKSGPSIAAFREAHPRAPLILALTGTDLYRDIRFDALAQASMETATRMIVLQERGLDELAPRLRAKTRVVYQSALPASGRKPPQRFFRACVAGHLREEKDPFRAAHALAHLPGNSRVRVVQVGRALETAMESQARELQAREPRYRWKGEVTHGQARRLIADSHVMIISSRMEGGANVVCEALASGTPVLASDIPGNVGMLGRDYDGYYPLGDERALAALLSRCESEPGFLRRLHAQCRARRHLVRPSHERRALLSALREAVHAA